MSVGEVVTAVCPTYGLLPTHTRLLEECIYWFTRQTYPNRELVIVNDAAGQTIVVDDPRVRVVNLPHRVPTVGEKMNIGCSAATGEIILPWEHDDIGLPRRIETTVAKLQECDYWNPQRYWTEDQTRGLFRETVFGVAHNTSGFRKYLWRKIPYPHTNQGHDAEYDRRLKAIGVSNLLFGTRAVVRSEPNLPPAEWVYVYRWGVSPLHLSAFHPHQQDAAYTNQPEPPPGVYRIAPRMHRDYERDCASLAMWNPVDHPAAES